MDAYSIYAKWCRDHGYAVPTEEWFRAICRLPLRNGGKDDDLQAEIDRERREGWAYG